jgi:hypothetical protein
VHNFSVRSAVNGELDLIATTRLSGADATLVAITSTTPRAKFMCVETYPDVATNPQTIQVLYGNPVDVPQTSPVPALTRWLNYIRVDWPADGTRQLVSISIRNSSNLVWAGINTATPLELSSGSLSSLYRSIPSGAIQPVQVKFNYNVAGTGDYIITAGWDDGAGGSFCYSDPVTITP